MAIDIDMTLYQYRTGRVIMSYRPYLKDVWPSATMPNRYGIIRASKHGFGRKHPLHKPALLKTGIGQPEHEP